MMIAKYMTSSGVVLAEPFWYLGCILIREDKTKEAMVTARTGLTNAGAPIWKYTLGETDDRSIRLMRDSDDAVLMEGGVYAEIAPDTTFIVYYRPLGA